MIKGCQRKIVMIKLDQKSNFETAYFVIRADVNEKINSKNTDIILEANKIISQSFEPSVNNFSKIKKITLLILSAITGFVLGIIFSAIVM